MKSRALRILRNYGPGILRFAIATRILTPVARWFGFAVLSDHFYHPIPSRATLRARAGRERPLDSIDWRLEEQVALLRKLLAEYEDEFNDPATIGSCGYDPLDASLHGADAAVLYAMVRSAAPERVVEIGSGGSTRIIGAALTRNHEETGTTPSLVTIDPSPQRWLDAFPDRVGSKVKVTVLKDQVQQVDPVLFRELRPGDILFVDSSHVFKQGSDVEHEFLQIYPSLHPGVRVHLHDIFFPFDYPLDWNDKHYRFWNEQYFLETFLQCNHRFEVTLSLSWMGHSQRDVLAKHVERYRRTDIPGSFWMTRAEKHTDDQLD